MTSRAEVMTAGSTQPPLTEPVNSPCWFTASLAPGRRGAEPCMLITVATAIWSPCSRQRSISGRISRMIENSFHASLCSGLAPGRRGLFARGGTARGPAVVDRVEQIAQVNQTVQVVDREEVIDIGQRGLHADGQRAIIGRAEQRIEPD